MNLIKTSLDGLFVESKVFAAFQDYFFENYNHAFFERAGIHFDDPQLAIDWRLEGVKASLSDKDKTAPDFQAYCLNPVF